MSDKPLSPEVVAAFGGIAPSDVVPRKAPDPEAVAALEAMHGQAVVFRDWEMTESGLRLIETEALLISTDEPLD